MPKPSSAAVGRARHIPASAEQVRSVSALLRILRSAFTRVHRVSRLECWMLSRERADAKVPAHFHSHRGLSPVMKGHSRFWGSVLTVFGYILREVVVVEYFNVSEK